MVSQISSYLQELNELEERLHVLKVGCDRWRPLEALFLKINFDVAFKALKLGVEMVIGEVVVEGDSLTVIKIAKSGSMDRLEIRAYIQDIKYEKRKFSKVWFTFIRRPAKASAHALAQEGWVRGESLNLRRRDLVAMVNLEAQDNLVRDVKEEDEVA
ncbi:hypothetical protein Goari_019647, partial [Gossypium aridum]|nr:hypothetical protein [Gossypium aridum]